MFCLPFFLFRVPSPVPCLLSDRSELPLHTHILLGLVVGVISGSVCRLLFGDSLLLSDFPFYVSEPFGGLVLRLIFLLLLFSAFVLSVAGLGDLRTLDHIDWKTFRFTLVATSLVI